MADATTLGCTACYGNDAQAVLAYYQSGGLEIDERLSDDSHFGVTIRHCTRCGQTFLFVFTEFVDWQGGEDDQYTDVVPISGAEAAEALQRPSDLQFLGSLGTGRRRLATAWPRGAKEKSIAWRTGAFAVVPGH
ncbi:MAG: hypothetical protein SFX73_33365 [Kofleriaceae bacterium]|nr:hypothetical protein [Kofleriaceae bacterium]